MSLHTSKVQALFERIVEIPANEQESWLIANCSDEQVRNDIRNLLGYIDSEMQSEGENLDDMAPNDMTGSVIDRYVIDRCIGEGIYTDVYLAHQVRPVKRRVAIKLMKLESAKMGQKFQVERQTLALMDHPSISTVFDGGCTEDGRFYLVMEFVDGIPITTYCNNHCLNIDQRLVLFEELCSAVQHAHTKSVIHRDLKPENILVTIMDNEPMIKVIDFGIARALEEPRQAGVTALISGTPRYMSPEQSNPEMASADTRSDVYSLGVILYELLTGLNPNDELDANRFPLQNENHNQYISPSVAKPSTATRIPNANWNQRATARQTTPGKLFSRFRGDLDWIVMRCLETDPENRYATPAELSVDIERHLKGLPVSAGPERFTYHLHKLISRHWIATAVGCLIFLIALFGAFLVFELRARSFDAYERADAFRSYLHTFITAIDPETAQYSDRQVVETMLNSASSEIHQNFAAHPLIAFQLHMDFAQAFQRIGSYGIALEHYQSSQRIAQDNFPANNPKRIQAAIMLGNGQLRAGQFNIANETLLGASAQSEKFLGHDHPYTVESDKHRSSVLNELGRYKEALVVNDTVINRLNSRLGPTHEDTLRAHCKHATTWINLGNAKDARPILEDLLKTCSDSLGNNHKLNSEIEEDLALAYGELGLLEKSEELERKILATRQNQLGSLHPMTLRVMSNLGTTLDLLDRPDEAIVLHSKALEGKQNVLGPNHPATVNTMINLAITLGQLERYEEAEFHEHNALEILNRTLGPEHPETLVTKSNLAVTKGLLGDIQKEIKLGQEVLKIRRQVLGSIHQDTLMTIYNLASAMNEIGEYENAEILALEAHEGYRKLFGDADPETIDCIDELIRIYDKQEKTSEAAKWKMARKLAASSSKTARPRPGTSQTMP